jgi:hypothetical protein
VRNWFQSLGFRRIPLVPLQLGPHVHGPWIEHLRREEAKKRTVYMVGFTS